MRKTVKRPRGESTSLEKAAATKAEHVRITPTYLTIREKAHVIAIESALNKFRHLFKDTVLTRRGRENLVELEVQRLSTSVVHDRKTLSIGQHIQTGVGILTIAGQEGSSADKNTDVAPKLLDTVVHLSSELLALEKFHLQLGNTTIAFFDARLQYSHVLHLLAYGIIVLIVISYAATGLDNAHLKLQLLHLLLEFLLLGLHGRLSTGLCGGKVGANGIELGGRGNVLVGEHLQLDLGLTILRLGGLQFLVLAQELVVRAGQ